VVEVALVHVVQVGELGEHRAQQAQPVGEREPLHRARRHHEPAQLGEDALARGLGNARRGGRGEPLGLLVRLEAQLGREAGQPQRAQRVALVGLRAEHAQRPGLEVGAAAERVDHVTAVTGARHRVHREVALSQVRLDRVALERREVVHAPGAAVNDPPRPEGLGEAEHRAAHLGGELAGGRLGVALHRDVDVGDLPAEQLVAQRAADYPGAAHRTCSRRTRGSRPVVTS
jgi:hypothetical protein